MNLCGFCGFRGINRGRNPIATYLRFTRAVPPAPHAQTPSSESTPGSQRGRRPEGPTAAGPGHRGGLRLHRGRHETSSGQVTPAHTLLAGPDIDLVYRQHAHVVQPCRGSTGNGSSAGWATTSPPPRKYRSTEPTKDCSSGSPSARTPPAPGPPATSPGYRPLQGAGRRTAGPRGPPAPPACHRTPTPPRSQQPPRQSTSDWSRRADRCPIPEPGWAAGRGTSRWRRRVAPSTQLTPRRRR